MSQHSQYSRGASIIDRLWANTITRVTASHPETGQRLERWTSNVEGFLFADTDSNMDSQYRPQAPSSYSGRQTGRVNGWPPTYAKSSRHTRSGNRDDRSQTHFDERPSTSLPSAFDSRDSIRRPRSSHQASNVNGKHTSCWGTGQSISLWDKWGGQPKKAATSSRAAHRSRARRHKNQQRRESTIPTDGRQSATASRPSRPTRTSSPRRGTTRRDSLEIPDIDYEELLGTSGDNPTTNAVSAIVSDVIGGDGGVASGGSGGISIDLGNDCVIQ